MTENQGAGRTAPPPPGPQDLPPGVDRQHLRNYEQLHRSVSDRKIAGVAGGLGHHLRIDPTVLRVLFVVLCFFGGAGFLLYVAAWLLVPEDGREEATITTSPQTRNVLLIAVAVVAALVLVGNGWDGVGFPWPVLVVGAGVAVFLALRDGGGHHDGAAAMPPGAFQPAGPAPGTAPPGTEPVGEATSVGTVDAGAPPPWVPPPWAPASSPAPYERPPRRSGMLLFGPTLALVAVALGSLGLYDALGGDVVPSAYPALALAVIGLVLVVGAFVGRAGGLVLMGVVAAIALAVTSIGSAVGGFHNAGGRRLDATPTSASTVSDNYFIPAGRVVLDLSQVRDPARLAGRDIEVGARAGEVVVVLPPGTTVDVDAEVTGPGEVQLPDQSADGFGNQLHDTLGSGATSLHLRAHLYAGHIEVRNP